MMQAVPDCDIANITMVDTFEQAVYRTIDEAGLDHLKKNGIVFRFKNDILVLSDTFLIVKMEDREFDYVGLPRFSEEPETDIRYQITITHSGKPRHLTKDWGGADLAETTQTIKLGVSEPTIEEDTIDGQGIERDMARQLAPSIKKQQQKQNNEVIPYPHEIPEPGTTRSGYERLFDMDPNDPYAGTREYTEQNTESNPNVITETISNTNNTQSNHAFGELDFTNIIHDDKVDPKVNIALKVIQGSSKDKESVRVLEVIKDKLTDLSYDGSNIFISLKGDDNLVKIGLLKSGKFRFTTEDWEHLKAYEKYK